MTKYMSSLMALLTMRAAPAQVISPVENHPAQDYATVAWQFVHLSGPASLTLYDPLGRPLAQTTITTPEGQWLWDTRTLPTGLYTYVLRDADQTILGQGKLTLSPR